MEQASKSASEAQRDSQVVAARVAMDQLQAMGAECFDIGVKRGDGTVLLREGWGTKQVLKSLLWLRRENLNRGHIVCCESFIGDGGGPPGVGLQEQIPNHPKLRG